MMLANTRANEKIVIVVRRGMVDSVFSNRKESIREVEIIDMDTTDVKEERRTKLRVKKARKIYHQIY